MQENLEIQDEILKNVERTMPQAVKPRAEPALSKAFSDAAIKVKYSIQLKFLIFILSLIVLIIFVVSYQQLRKTKAELLASVDEKADLILENLNTVSFNAMFNPDGVDDLLITEIVNKYCLDPSKNIAEVIVYFPDGTVIGHPNINAYKGKKLSDYISSKYVNTRLLLNKNAKLRIADEKNQINYYLKPVTSEIVKKPIGVIRLAIDTRYVQNAIRDSSILILITSFIILAIAVVLTILMTRLITTPIEAITKDVKRVGEGHLDHQISVKTSDEIGFLADEFNKMTSNLLKAQLVMVSAASTQKELELAGEIQQGLLPNGLLKYDKIEAFGISRPAKTVGGDYFDFFQISDRLYASVISDVSGKGIPAGLIMTMIKTIIKTATYENVDNPVSRVVNVANKYLTHNSAPGKFATISFTLYNTSTYEIINSDGGHGDYYIFRGKEKKLIKLNLPEGNMPIGVMDTVEYLEVKTQLETGDYVCFFTDGITEARNIEEKDYGEERIQKVLLDNFHLNAQGLTEALMKDCTDFIGKAPQHDDMTVLTIKIVG